MRILVDDVLKLLVRGRCALFRAGKTWLVRLWRHVGRPHWRIQRAHRLAELQAGFLVLLIQVVPRAKAEPCNYQHGDPGDNQLVLMFDRPMHCLLGYIDRGLAKTVLFQLMTGFCAHELPF
jgi:hypothetical protein